MSGHYNTNTQPSSYQQLTQQSNRSRQAPQQAQNSMDPQYTKLMQAMNDKLNKGNASYAVQAQLARAKSSEKVTSHPVKVIA